jgi:hypothetical protein
MGSQVEFVMHPDDEAAFVAEILRDPDVAFVNGPRWPQATPATARSLDGFGSYGIAWSRVDLDPLPARYIPTCDDWYCEGEHATIQFLRSEPGEDSLTTGRIAIHGPTDGFDGTALTRRFNRLRRYIKSHFSNAALVSTQHPDYVFKSLWVGPNAVQWLRANDRRVVRTPMPGRLRPELQRAPT